MTVSTPDFTPHDPNIQGLGNYVHVYMVNYQKKCIFHGCHSMGYWIILKR